MVTGRRILLLADDSPATQKVVSLTFADEGLEVVAVGDGAEAARRLEEGLTPDVVLADVIMPGLTGYELCERIKGGGRLAHVPVVLLVGTFEPFNEAEARRVGADTVLTKPFQSIRDLVSKVGSLLGGAKPEAEDETARPAAAPPEEAPRQEAAPEREASRPEAAVRRDTAASFADMGLDDELIEARPAENYAETHQGRPAPDDARLEATGAHAEAEAPPAPVAAAADEAAHDSFADTLRDPFAASRGAGGREEAPAFGESQPSFARVPGAEEARAPQPAAFAARVAGAAAADDALLDLDLDAPAPVNEADDFILDLGDEEERPAFQSAAPAAAAPQPDTAGAFAEAAHGETVQDSRAAVQQLEDIQVAHEHMATAVVAQDEPRAPAGEHSLGGEREFSDVQDFGSHTAREVMSAAVVDEAGASAHEASSAPPFGASVEEASAPRGFVEPEVVPAAEAPPAVVEAEFRDGSVEGDVAKPPTGGFAETHYEAGAAPVAEPDAAHVVESAAPARAAEGTSAAPESPFPPVPSTAGYEMGAARVGVEERVRPEQLSPEVIETIARRVVELMSDKVVREIAWEVVPDLAELLIKQKIDEDARKQ